MNYKVGDKVYAWSNERYGKSYITECVIEEIADDILHLYAIEENRAFYRKTSDVLSINELHDNLHRLNIKIVQ